MSEQHTPGRLTYVIGEGEIEAEINGAPVVIAEAYVDGGTVYLPSEANAARLVACWNACLGMSDPQATIAALIAALRGITDYAEDDDMYPDRLLPDLIVAGLAALDLVDGRSRATAQP